MSNVLSTAKATLTTVSFDPALKKHRAAYAFFRQNRQWPIDFRFKSEWPCTSVVATVENKLAAFAIRSELKALGTPTNSNAISIA